MANAKDYQVFIDYVVAKLNGNENEIDYALSRIERYRCSLSAANETIMSLLDNAERDYCTDNDIDYYEFNVEETFEKDWEDIFFDAIGLMDKYKE